MKILKGLAVVIIMFGLLSMLFGCKTDKKPDYPFDVEKAYYRHRSGVMAGGRYKITTEPENIVEVYSYSIPVPEYEAGMHDKGADIYYVGITPGEVTVTETEYFPTCEPESFSFVLCVDENLCVFLKENE
ncbi:MAG: hypothetical protein IJA92_00580 [Oscillospiraceae bacterium]|nr:hypothetical protein [Oscillospiraceae bacterium]